jgi:hypothetical protein
MIGFETIGSATIIVHDDVPVLTTDAWINRDAYFGSWCHDYEIPSLQLDSIKRAKFHWFSHGHPDHLNVDSLPDLTGGQFLLSDHFGGRINRDLKAAGYNVCVLPDRKWIRLSKNVAVWSYTNKNQDSILLININGRFVIDANDSPDFGSAWHIKRLVRGAARTYLCQLHGWGGADMLNLFDPSGRPLTEPNALRRTIAPRAQRSAIQHGATHFIPFSSFHRYQRTDSAWANELIPDLGDYQSGAMKNAPEVLPPFIRVDCVNDRIEEIKPRRTEIQLRKPEDFGDSWSDSLEKDDFSLIDDYFKSRVHLSEHFGFIEVKSGGVVRTVRINRSLGDVGVSFEVPRSSLIASLKYEVFDDLLIGNYMKTTLHNVKGLYPEFSPFVAKYADNGGAKTESELGVYFHHYRMRDPIGMLMTKFATSSEQMFRKFVTEDSFLFSAVKKAYYSLKSGS